MQPAANIVARRAAAVDALVMTAAAAQVARPALRARFLAMYMAFSKPPRSPIAIDIGQRSHRALSVLDEAMACRKLAVGGHAEICGASAARIGAVGAAMDLAHRVDHVVERIALARDQPPLEGAAAIDHCVQHGHEIGGLQFAAAAGGR